MNRKSMTRRDCRKVKMVQIRMTIDKVYRVSRKEMIDCSLILTVKCLVARCLAVPCQTSKSLSL